MEEKPVKTDSQEKIIEIDEINENLIKKNKEKRSRPSPNSCLKIILYAVFHILKKFAQKNRRVYKILEFNKKRKNR